MSSLSLVYTDSLEEIYLQTFSRKEKVANKSIEEFLNYIQGQKYVIYMFTDINDFYVLNI